MRKRWSVLALTVMAVLGVGMSAGAADLKIGVIEPQKVLEGTRSGKKVKNMLADYVGTRQKLLDSEAEDLKRLEDELIKQGSVLSPQVRQEKEELLRQKMAQYQRRTQDLEAEVQAKKTEMLGEFTKTLEQAVQEVAESEKISLVMEKGDNGFGSLVFFNSPSIDLTDRVIKVLDSKK